MEGFALQNLLTGPCIISTANSLHWRATKPLGEPIFVEYVSEHLSIGCEQEGTWILVN